MRDEFKKLFSSKLMWFVMLLTAAYMVFLPLREVWGSMAQMRESAESFEAVLDDVNTGGLTQDELSQMRNDIFQSGLGSNSGSYVPRYSGSAAGDLVAIERASELMSYCGSGFEQDRRELVKGMVYQNDEKRKKEQPDSYLIRANERAIEQYNRCVDLKLQSTGISADISYAAFNYSMWEYVMIALCVLMTVRLFSCEYSSGAFRTVNTSKKTVQSLFFKKYFAVVTVAVGVLAVQAIFELAMGALVFGLKNFSDVRILSVCDEYCAVLPVQISAQSACICDDNFAVCLCHHARQTTAGGKRYSAACRRGRTACKYGFVRQDRQRGKLFAVGACGL